MDNNRRDFITFVPAKGTLAEVREILDAGREIPDSDLIARLVRYTRYIEQAYDIAYQKNQYLLRKIATAESGERSGDTFSSN